MCVQACMNICVLYKYDVQAGILHAYDICCKLSATDPVPVVALLNEVGKEQ